MFMTVVLLSRAVVSARSERATAARNPRRRVRCAFGGRVRRRTSNSIFFFPGHTHNDGGSSSGVRSANGAAQIVVMRLFLCRRGPPRCIVDGNDANATKHFCRDTAMLAVS